MEIRVENPIRVLQVIGSMNRGGAESMIMNLYRAINRSKVQFDFLVHTPLKGKYDEEIMNMGGHIYRIRAFNGYNAALYYLECKAFFRDHKEIAVVHGHIGSSAALYLLAAKKAGLFTIAHSHSAQKNIMNVHDLFYRVFSYPTRYIANQLFGCSTEAGIRRFGRRFATSKKYMNFYNAIPLEHFLFNNLERQIVRKELGVEDDESVVITVGRITKQKNPRFIYDVFRYIVCNWSDVICVWVGTGPEELVYKDLIRKNGLQKRVLMTGVRSDVERILNAADCFFFPSLWEGLPVSVVEAQANGLPCVISDLITKEVEITKLIEWHSLDESVEEWSNACLNLAHNSKNNRETPLSDIKDSGYDIHETSKWLQEYYIQMAKEK